MIYLEACLLAILSVLFLHTSVSDLKSGRISNKSILVALGMGSICAVFYYLFFAADCLLPYFVNVGLSVVIGVLLYVLGIWGAGDSKLLLTTIILFPARLYCLSNRSLASCFILIAIIFIVAFVSIVLDTINLGIRQKNLFVIPKQRINWKSYAKSFLFFFPFLSLSNTIVRLILPKSIISDSVLLTAIQFVMILIGMDLERRANWLVVLTMGIAWAILIVLGVSRFEFSGVNI